MHNKDATATTRFEEEEEEDYDVTLISHGRYVALNHAQQDLESHFKGSAYLRKDYVYRRLCVISLFRTKYQPHIPLIDITLLRKLTKIRIVLAANVSYASKLYIISRLELANVSENGKLSI